VLIREPARVSNAIAPKVTNTGCRSRVLGAEYGSLKLANQTCAGFHAIYFLAAIPNSPRSAQDPERESHCLDRRLYRSSVLRFMAHSTESDQVRIVIIAMLAA
jgi:hypothetical protein